MPPHDEGAHCADERLDQVQQDLEQEVESECPRDGLTVTHPFVGEGASYGVVAILNAHAGLSLLLTGEAAGLRVVVSGECHRQHGNDQTGGAQEEVEEL